MRYDDDELQDLLAAEFVCGSLRGAARARLATLMRGDRGLRAKVRSWEERLFPLLLANTPPLKPPRRVWRAIQARVAPRRHALRAWWRGIAAAGALAIAALVSLVILAPQAPPAATMVAVLSDERAQAGMLVSWTPAVERRLRVRILAHPQMPPGTSWQAWVTRPGAGPVSLGLVTAEAEQTLELSAPAAEALRTAMTIGISVEPKGGSPSGVPSGAFLFEGRVLRIDG